MCVRARPAEGGFADDGLSGEILAAIGFQAPAGTADTSLPPTLCFLVKRWLVPEKHLNRCSQQHSRTALGLPGVGLQAISPVFDDEKSDFRL